MDNTGDFYSLNVGSIPTRRTNHASVMELVYVPDLKSGFCGFESRHLHHKENHKENHKEIHALFIVWC